VKDINAANAGPKISVANKAKFPGDTRTDIATQSATALSRWMASPSSSVPHRQAFRKNLNDQVTQAGVK
jgi:hypothetical protein